MVVIKKTDQQENFSYEKLANSVRAANAETGEPLDVELLLMEFQNLVANNDYVTTGQINVIVYGLLYAKNALQTLKNYAEYKKQPQP
ncbi:MAG: ATP cone domain-containing protein [Oscillospiraceae bacterium]